MGPGAQGGSERMTGQLGEMPSGQSVEEHRLEIEKEGVWDRAQASGLETGGATPKMRTRRRSS